MLNKMIAALHAIGRFACGLFKKTTVSFSSDFDLDESVRRLQEVVIQETFWGLLTMRIRNNHVIGKVTGTTVTIRWSRSFLEDFLALYFTGRFNRNETGRVVLTGVFTMHWLLKIFIDIRIFV